MKDIKNLEAELIHICDDLISKELQHFSENVQRISENFNSHKENFLKTMVYQATLLMHDYGGLINSLEIMDKIRNILQIKSIEYNLRITDLFNHYNQQK